MSAALAPEMILALAAELREDGYWLPTPSWVDPGEYRTWLYFIQAGESGPIKIGTAKNVEQRLTALQISNPELLSLRACVFTTKRDEGKAQRHFADERIRGEWFRPSPRLLATITAIRGLS